MVYILADYGDIKGQYMRQLEVTSKTFRSTLRCLAPVTSHKILKYRDLAQLSSTTGKRDSETRSGVMNHHPLTNLAGRQTEAP